MLSSAAQTYITDGLSAPLVISAEIISAINAGGVNTINGTAGPHTFIGGTGITITPSGSTFTIASTGGGANTFLSNLTSPTAINQSLVPNATNTFNIGSSLESWNNVYVSNILSNAVLSITDGPGDQITMASNSITLNTVGAHNASMGIQNSGQVYVTPSTGQVFSVFAPLKLWNNAENGTITQQANTSTANYTVTWPPAQGAASTVLTNDGAGNLSWGTPSGANLEASVAPGYTLAPFSNLLAFTSNPGIGGAAAVIFTVQGLLATDTIIGVTQSVVGGTAVYALLEWTAQGNNTLTGHYVGDPGSGAVIIVLVMR